MWSIQRGRPSDASSGLSNCNENMNVESLTQTLSTYSVYTSTKDKRVRDMIASATEPHTNRGNYDRVHFISQCKRPNGFCHALICNDCAKTCNDHKNTPIDNWGRMANAPEGTRGNGEAA